MSAADYANDAAVAELLALGARHSAAKSDGTLAVHRAASSVRAAGPPADATSVSAANATRLLIQASVSEAASTREADADADSSAAGTSTLDASSDAGTPFLLACSRGAEATIVMLAEMGADTRATLRTGVGGASLAAASGSLGALLAALAAGVPTASRPPGGMSALHIAASHPNTAEDSPALVAALLAAGADPDVAGLLVQNIG